MDKSNSETQVEDKAEGVAEDQEELSYEDIFDEISSEDAKEQEASPEPSRKDPDEAAGKAAQQGDTDSKDEGEDNPYNWIEALPEEFREKAKALKEERDKTHHSFQSQTGRVRSLQAQLDEERREREAAARLRASQANEPGKPPASAAAANKELAEKVKKAKEEYPDLVDLIDSIAAQRAEEIKATIDERVRPFQENDKRRQYEANRRAFEDKAATILDTENTGVTYQQVFGSEEYADFLSNQPAYIRDKAQTSTDPEEAASILELFVKDQRIKMLEEQSNQPENPSKERKKRLERNVSPESRSAVGDTKQGGMTYDDWFDHYATS